jgi:GNAT superfamily N-acetyltransferase
MPNFPDFSYLTPAIGPERVRPAPRYSLRHPTDADFAALADRLADWADHSGDATPGRVWFRDFASSGWLAETDEGGRPLGIVLGFVSPERPGEAVLQYLSVDPANRRKGIGSRLVRDFEQAVRATGATRVSAACRPDHRAMLVFLGSLGYAPLELPGGQRLYGVPAVANWNGSGEDRAVLEHVLS